MTRWYLGTCIPAGILDKGGSLCQNPESLKHLSLITNGACTHAGCQLEGLSKLTSLKTLMWEGLQSPMEIDALQQCLQQNHLYLRTLSIGMVPTGSLDWQSSIFGFRRLSLEEKEEMEPIQFPSLSCLSLSNCILPAAWLRTGHILPFHALRALTLRDCVHQVHLIQLLSQSSNSICLRHLEICSDYLFEGYSIWQTLVFHTNS